MAKKAASKKTTRKKAPRKKAAAPRKPRSPRPKTRAPLTARQMACLKLVVEWNGVRAIDVKRIEDELKPNPVSADISHLVELKLVQPATTAKGRPSPRLVEPTQAGINEFEAEWDEITAEARAAARNRHQDNTLRRMATRVLMVLEADPLVAPDEKDDSRNDEIDRYLGDGIDDGEEEIEEDEIEAGDLTGDPDDALDDEDEDEDGV